MTNVHHVSGAGIWIHDLLNTSRLLQPLNQGSRPKFFFCKIFLLIIKHSYYKLLQTINLHIYTCTRIEVDDQNPTIINDVIYVNKPVNSQ